MNERHQFIPVDDESRPATSPGNDIVPVLRYIIGVVREWYQFVAGRLRKLPQRFADPLSDPPRSFPLRTLGGNADDRGEER